MEIQPRGKLIILSEEDIAIISRFKSLVEKICISLDREMHCSSCPIRDICDAPANISTFVNWIDQAVQDYGESHQVIAQEDL